MTDKKIVSFGRVFWPSLLAISIVAGIGLIVFFVFISGIIGSFGEEKPLTVEQSGVLHLTLEGEIAEKSTSNLDPTSLSMNQKIGLSDLLFGFEKAKKDRSIKGIFLEIKGANCGMASAKEIRDAINSFENSGKFVVAYTSGEMITQKQYYIASAANEIYTFPTSVMEFVGLGAELTFFKKTLDKLGISVQVIRGYDNHFKSAVEPFFLEKMSDSSRLQMHRYMTSIWEDVRKDIATDRKISEKKLFQIAEKLSIKRAQDAVDLKLVDGVKYKDEVLDLIRKKAGLKGNNVLEFTRFEKYAQRKFKDQQTLNRVNNPNIAVVVAEGDIAVDGAGISSTKLCRTLRELRSKKGIKVAVIRINSPGGSALASDEIWREITLLKKKMNVIVSMGDVAASGGYYIATPADYIFAEKTTITGSIGVFGVIPYTGKFLEDKFGLSFDRIATNQHAVLSTNRPLTAEELTIMQTEVNAIYDDFIERVAEGRKLTKNQVHAIARGRVWTGKDAKKIGLVDQIGGIPEAINYAKKIAGIENEIILYMPKVKEDPFQAIYDLIEEQEDREEMSFSKTEIPEEWKTYLNEFLRIKSMKGIQMRLPYSINIH